MERAAHTIVGASFERRDARVVTAIGSDRDDRQIGCVAAKVPARLRDVRGHHENHVRLEHVQQPHRPPVGSDGEHIVSVAS
jgi:hypothetical protein